MPDYHLKLGDENDRIILRRVFNDRNWPVRHTSKRGVFYLSPKEVGPVVEAFVAADIPFILQHK